MKSKIVIVSPYAEPERGAAPIRTHSLADSFSKSGFNVKIFSPVRGTVSSTKLVRRYTGIRELMGWIWESNPSLVIGVSPPITHNFFALSICKLKKIPFILDAKDDRIALAPERATNVIRAAKQKAYFFMRKWCYQNAAAAAFLTREDLLLEKKRYGLKQSLEVVQNGTEPALFEHLESAKRAYARAKLGFSDKSFGIAYAGSLGDEEVIEFLDAIREKLSATDSFVLLVVSIDGTKHNRRLLLELKNHIAKIGVSKQCKVITNVPYKQMGKLFGLCDIAVLPWPDDLQTSLPVKIFDYAAAGLPVVAKAAKGPISELIQKHQIGVIATDWMAVSQQLFSLLEDEEERKRLGKNGRSMVEKYFVRSKNNEKMIRLARDFLEMGEKESKQQQIQEPKDHKH